VETNVVEGSGTYLHPYRTVDVRDANLGVTGWSRDFRFNLCTCSKKRYVRGKLCIRDANVLKRSLT